MASSSDRISDIVAGPIAVGLSALIGITGIANQSALQIKYVSGGSLIVGGSACINGAALAVGGANGYLMGTTEIMSLNTSGTVWVTAKNATAIIHVVKTITG